MAEKKVPGGEIHIVFGDDGKPRIKNLAGDLPEGTKNHVMELLGWIEEKAKGKDSDDSDISGDTDMDEDLDALMGEETYRAESTAHSPRDDDKASQERSDAKPMDNPGGDGPMARPSNDPSSLAGGEMAGEDQVLNQDAGGAGHIHPAEQAQDGGSRIIDRDEEGAPPIEQDIAQPITAGPHALSSTKDGGKHVDPNAGAINPGMDEMIAARTGEVQPQLNPALQKQFEGLAQRLRARIDEAIDANNHQELKRLHKEFTVLKEEYANAMEEAREHAQVTAAANEPTPLDNMAADQVPETPPEQAIEEAPAPEMPPEPDFTGDSSDPQDTQVDDPSEVNGLLEDLSVEIPDLFDFDDAPIPEPPPESAESMSETAGGNLPPTDTPDDPSWSEAGPVPPTMAAEAPAAEGGPPAPGAGGAPPPPPPGEDEEKSLTAQDLAWAIKSVDGGLFFPLFLDLEKARQEGAGSGKNQAKGAANRKAVKTGKQARGPGGFKYIKRWWAKGRWNYRYATEPSDNAHGIGKNATQAAAHFEEHTIETHPGLLRDRAGKKKKGMKQKDVPRVGEPYAHIKDAAHAYQITIRAHNQGYEKIKPTERPPTVWKEQDKDGNWHIFRQEHQVKTGVSHMRLGKEDPGDPHTCQLDGTCGSTLASFKSYRVTEHSVKTWKDKKGKEWLTMHKYTGQATDPKTKEVKQYERYKLNEVSGNTRGIAGEAEFNEFTFRSRAAAERAARFIVAFERSEGDGNRPIRAFNGLGKESSSMKSKIAQDLEMGKVNYRASKAFVTLDRKTPVAADDNTVDKLTIYRLVPDITSSRLKQLVADPVIQGGYVKALGRAKSQFAKRYGTQMSSSTEAHLLDEKNMQAFVLELLSMTHVPGSNRFMSGYVPGSNLGGYIANAMASKKGMGGVLLDKAHEVQSGNISAQEFNITGAIEGPIGSYGNLHNLTPDQVLEIQDRAASLQEKGEDHEPQSLVHDVDVSDEPDDSDGPMPAERPKEEYPNYYADYVSGQQFEDSPMPEVTYKSTEADQKEAVGESEDCDNGDRTLEAQRNARVQYGSAGGAYTDDTESVPLAVGEDSGVPGSEVIRRSFINMSDEEEGRLTHLVKGIYHSIKRGEITQEFAESKPFYNVALDVLELRKRARVMKSAASEVAPHNAALFFLCDLIDVSLGLYEGRSIDDVMNDHSGDLTKSMNCSEWHATIHAQHWFRELKAHPLFKSAVYLSLAVEWDGEIEGEMFKGMAREALTRDMLNLPEGGE